MIAFFGGDFIGVDHEQGSAPLGALIQILHQERHVFRGGLIVGVQIGADIGTLIGLG